MGGRYVEENVDKIEVTPGCGAGENWGTTVMADRVRDGLFVAYELEPEDRSDVKFKAVVTDKAGRTSTVSYTHLRAHET